MEFDETAETLQGYNILEESTLGEGTFGLVREGVLKSTGRKVAIKSTKVTEEVENPLIVFRSEIFAYKALSQHPNIVTLIASFQEEDVGYIVFELMDGDSIFISQNYLDFAVSEDIAMKYYRDCKAGLMYMHKHGFVHMDLKPANVLGLEISKGVYQWKIGDLGLTCQPDMGGCTFGTPYYRSPETYTKPRESFTLEDYKRVDMWALGATVSAFAYERNFVEFAFLLKDWVLMYLADYDDEVEAIEDQLRPSFGEGLSEHFEDTRGEKELAIFEKVFTKTEQKYYDAVAEFFGNKPSEVTVTIKNLLRVDPAERKY